MTAPRFKVGDRVTLKGELQGRVINAWSSTETPGTDWDYLIQWSSGGLGTYRNYDEYIQHMTTPHNPDNLPTPEPPWRFLDEDEIKDRRFNEQIYQWNRKTAEWIPGFCGDTKSATYRTTLTREELAAITPEAKQEESHKAGYFTTCPCGDIIKRGQSLCDNCLERNQLTPPMTTEPTEYERLREALRVATVKMQAACDLKALAVTKRNAAQDAILSFFLKEDTK